MDRMVQRFAFFVVVALCPTLLYAQASITGTVKDNSGAVLPGVTVEASSPALIEKVRAAVTDGTGQYRIVDLRPGKYSVTFALTGFGSVKREGIELTGTFTATVNADLQVGSITETVTVSGQSPIIDVQNTEQQRVLSTDMIESLPSARTPGTLAVLVPGVTSLAGTQDVGGTESLLAVSQLTIHGGATGDFRIMMDGFVAGANGKGLQFANNQPNMGSTQEVNVQVGTNSAEQSSSGVIINFLPKEGGNKFAGSMFVGGAGSGMASSNFTQRLKDLGLATQASIKNSYDVNPSFGGPIKQDKLWFFASARWFGYENYQGIFYNANGGNPNLWSYVADPSRPAFNHAYSRSGNGRLTWQISPKNKLSVFYDKQFKCECLQTGNSGFWARSGGYTVSPEAAVEYRNTPTWTSLVTWSSPLTNRLLLEVGGAFKREGFTGNTYVPGSPALDLIPVTELSSNLVYHGTVELGGPAASSASAMYQHYISNAPQLRASLSYIAGAHAFKVGFTEQYLSDDESLQDNNSHTGYMFNNGVPVSLYERASPFPEEGKAPWDLGIYAQDRWTIHRLTADLGLRFAYFKNEWSATTFGPGPLVPTRNFTLPAGQFYSLKDLTPRLGVAYDLLGNGRTAVKFAANKYLATPSIFGGNPSSTISFVATRSWNDRLFGAGDPRTSNFVPDCTLTTTAANGECGALSDALFGQQKPSTTIDPATNTGFGARGYNWEFMSAVSQELVSNRVSVDVGYFRRIFGNLLVTYNRALPPAAYDPYSVTAPVDARLGSSGGQVISGLYDLNPAFTVGGIPTDNFQTYTDNFGKQYQHWNGVDVNFKARLANATFAGGVSSGRTSSDNCDVVAQLRVVTAVAPFGAGPLCCHVDTNFLTQVKGFGTYVVPKIDVQIAGTFQSVPGPQRLANVNFTTAQVAPSLGRPLSSGRALVAVNVVPPGTTYGERLNQLDMRVGKILNFGGRRTSINLDVYNLLNSDTVLTEVNSYATWLKPLSVVKSRFAKVSATINF